MLYPLYREQLRPRARKFAYAVAELSHHLRHCGEAILANQFIRSGTSIGANIAEGRYPETRGDLISKYSIALKEASETRYWLELFEDMGIITPNGRFGYMHALCEEIIDILVKAIKSAKAARRREERRAQELAKPRRKRLKSL